MMIISILFVWAYGAGSIPFGLVLARMGGHGDIRTIGSGNIGATNVLRTGNKKLAIITLACDAFKGVFAIIPAMLLDMPYWVMGACGTLAVIGHVFPIWLKGKGGKGVATTLAVYWTLYWPLGLVASLSWLLCAYVTRISSLSALVAMVVTMVMSFFFGPSAYIIVTIILGVIVIYRHKSNIKNIIKGSEPTIGKTCE